MRRLFFLYALVSLQAQAQAPSTNPAAAAPAAPAPAPAAQPAKPAEPPRRLILRLDEMDGPKPSFGASAGETYGSQNLPSLGGDAMKVDPSKLRSSPYPETDPNLR